jgi:AcrR family transcriptional regulator
MARLPAGVRRAQLISAAITVATRDGIEAATTRRIAKEVGVTVGVVHYCFGTKANLYREVIKSIVDEMTESIALASRPGDDLRSYLSRAVEAYCTAVESEPDKHRLTYELTTYAVRTPNLEDLGTWQYHCYFSAAREFFLTAAETAGIAWSLSVDTLARMLIGLNEGLTLAWLVDRRGDKLRQVYAAFVDQLVALALPAGPGEGAGAGRTATDGDAEERR